MIEIQNAKMVVGLAPISLNSAAATALTVDTRGFSYAAMVCTLGVVGGAATVFKIQESATDFSGADVSGYVGSGSTGNTRLPQTGDAGKTIIWGLPLGGSRLRYLQLAVTTGATTLISVQWFLFRANESPNTNTERGVAYAYFG